MRILTNNPKKIHGLAGYGLELTDQIPLRTEPNPNNLRYLETKRTKLGHTLGEKELVPGSLRPIPSPAARQTRKNLSDPVSGQDPGE